MGYNYRCRECGGNCDAGELHNGVCEDCISEEKARQERDKKRAELLTCQEDGQMMIGVMNHGLLLG